MPINRNEKLLFVHIPKCAGTSIEKTLNMYQPYLTPANTDIMFGVTNDNIVLQSLCLEYYEKFIEKKLIDECKIFTVVRNPYDRILSDYTWFNRGFNSILNFIIFIKKILSTTNKEKIMNFNGKYLLNHILPQNEYINNTKYDVKILKFESLNEDFSKLFPNKNLCHVNKTSHLHYLEFFKDKPKCIKLINEIYDDDFKYFGYDTITLDGV